MQTGTVDTYCKGLSDFLASEILADDTAFTPDSELADLGVDSFALMEIILYIERTWGVVVPMDRLTPDATRSVRGLSTCLAGLIA
jgi:acyl carrier protein